MESEVDTSILNSVNIKRFTRAVLEEHGADIDRSNSAQWEVSFPLTVSDKLDRQRGTLVFDSADRELGGGDLLVQPGTTVFSALLELVQQSASVGQLRLSEDTVQVTPPRVLAESELAVEIQEFHKRTSDLAVTFHFRVQFETPASFHREEMMSVTVDPETQTRLPALTERLTAHLPQLLEENDGHDGGEVPAAAVEAAHDEAQQAVIDRSRPIIEELRDEAAESTSERIDEISEWYEQRRSELDDQIAEQQQEIRKWKEKRRKARKDSTRRKYIRNRKEAESELERLEQEVERKKTELDREESDEIDDVIDRNEVTVDVTLLGVTEVSYVRGTLALAVSSDHAETVEDVSYLPATDDYHGLDCHVCSQDLTAGVLPRLCTTGHLVGDPCARSCRSCGLTYCDGCETDHEFAECTICWDDVCQSCIGGCLSCGSQVCTEHRSTCTTCDEATCRLCGEECSTCGAFHCDAHLSWCGACGDHHCTDHVEMCDICAEPRCEAHLEQCVACDDAVCSDHRGYCRTCGDTLCDQHFYPCQLCPTEPQQPDSGFCKEHRVECAVDGDTVCADHRTATTLGTGYICTDHLSGCSTCSMEYGDHNLQEGQCSACGSFGAVDTERVPTDIRESFRSVKAGSNDAYMVILGKKLLGRNKVIVYDRRSNKEVHRESAGALKQLLGGYR